MRIYDISQEVFGCNVFPGDSAPEKEILSVIAKDSPCNLSAFRRRWNSLGKSASSTTSGCSCGCSISFFPERKNNRPGKTGKIYRKCLCNRTHFWERKLCCWKESVWIGFPKDAIS